MNRRRQRALFGLGMQRVDAAHEQLLRLAALPVRRQPRFGGERRRGETEPLAFGPVAVGLEQRIRRALSDEILERQSGLTDLPDVAERFQQGHALAGPALAAASGWLAAVLLEGAWRDLPDRPVGAARQAVGQHEGNAGDDSKADAEPQPAELDVAPVHVDEDATRHIEGRERQRPHDREEQEQVAVVRGDREPAAIAEFIRKHRRLGDKRDAEQQIDGKDEGA